MAVKQLLWVHFPTGNRRKQLAAVTVDVANDSVIIYDNSGTATGKETIADFISAIAEIATTSSGVLNGSGASIGLAIALGQLWTHSLF